MFGELLSQPSRLAPNAAVDSTVGQLVAAGLATSATLICAALLRSATRCGLEPQLHTLDPHSRPQHLPVHVQSRWTMHAVSCGTLEALSRCAWNRLPVRTPSLSGPPASTYKTYLSARRTDEPLSGLDQVRCEHLRYY